MKTLCQLQKALRNDISIVGCSSGLNLTSRDPQLSQDLMEGNFGITSLFRLEARGLKYVGGPKGNEKEKKHPTSVVPRHTTMMNDKKICKFGHF